MSGRNLKHIRFRRYDIERDRSINRSDVEKRTFTSIFEVKMTEVLRETDRADDFGLRFRELFCSRDKIYKLIVLLFASGV